MSTKGLALLLLSLTAPLVSAIGSARVVNSCPFLVDLWAVGGNSSLPMVISSTSSWEEIMFTDPQSGGRTLKISLEARADGKPDSGIPQTDFAYSLVGDTVWYDLSDVFGDPFAGHKLKLGSVDGGCGVIEWPTGVNPGGSQVKSCGSGSDVVLELCAV